MIQPGKSIWGTSSVRNREMIDSALDKAMEGNWPLFKYPELVNFRVELGGTLRRQV